MCLFVMFRCTVRSLPGQALNHNIRCHVLTTRMTRSPQLHIQKKHYQHHHIHIQWFEIPWESHTERYKSASVARSSVPAIIPRSCFADDIIKTWGSNRGPRVMCCCECLSCLDQRLEIRLRYGPGGMRIHDALHVRERSGGFETRREQVDVRFWTGSAIIQNQADSMNACL